MAQGRDIMKGRHNVGGKTGSAGKIRSGQSEPASNKFKTNARPEFSRKSPLVPDNANTSRDAQVMIKEAPDPFKNKMQVPQMPAPKGPNGAVPGPVRKPYAGLQNKTVGNKALPSGAPVGQTKPINQSGQVNGRMGTSFPRKKGNNGAGFPSKRNASFYGE